MECPEGASKRISDMKGVAGTWGLRRGFLMDVDACNNFRIKIIDKCKDWIISPSRTWTAQKWRRGKWGKIMCCGLAVSKVRLLEGGVKQNQKIIF